LQHNIVNKGRVIYDYICIIPFFNCTARTISLQSQIDAALALNNASKIYAELQNTLEQLNNAIGLPRYYQMEKMGNVTLDTFDEKIIDQKIQNVEKQGAETTQKTL
jgi:phosphomannomutase